MNGFNEAIAEIERRRSLIDVFSPSAGLASSVVDQFETKNVSVRHASLPVDDEVGFIIVRAPDESFLGSLGVETFEALLSPSVHPPWVLADAETDYREIFEFLDDTLFSSFDRRQMLATAREIEERAWRIGAGRLATGFQTADALRTQTWVYDRLAERSDLSIELYVSDEWDVAEPSGPTVHAELDDEIGSYWFVLFDGDGADVDKCGLIAEERSPGTYYGFWTYDPDLVDELFAHLDALYESC